MCYHLTTNKKQFIVFSWTIPSTLETQMYQFLLQNQEEIVAISRILTFMIFCGGAISMIIAHKIVYFGGDR